VIEHRHFFFIISAIIVSCQPSKIDPIALEDGDSNPVHEAFSDSIDQFADDIDVLNSIGYLGGVEEPAEKEGITIYDPNRAQPGLNFYVSAHKSEAILMDMTGSIIHRWHYPFSNLHAYIGEATITQNMQNVESRHWRRAWLYPNGDLLAIHDSIALVKIDQNSNVLWVYPQGVHHDLHVLPDNTIYAISHENRIDPTINPDKEIRDDLIVILDPDGNEIKRISLYQCIKNSDVRPILDAMPRSGDLFHTNSIQVLDGSYAHIHPAFKKGNVLISILMTDTIAVLDLKQEKVVWYMQGSFRFQHEAKTLPNGNLLLFDNFGPALKNTPISIRPGAGQSAWYSYIFNPELPEKSGSAILEIDPLTKRTIWEYQGTPANPFSSETCGTTYRLANGNTLITETQYGRAFEITPTGEIVWEFVSPHRFGENVARLFDLQRVDPLQLSFL